MRAVMLDVPADLLAERRQLGLDRFDEMWEGVLHMVPAPGNEHQRIGTKLVALLDPVAEAAGLEARYEFGLYDPDVPGHHDFRVPDFVVFRPDVVTERGVEGAASLVVEIVSPGDDSLVKLPFFERVGVAEVLLIEQDTKVLRHWAQHDDRLVEQVVPAGGAVALAALPITLRTDSGRLHVETATGERWI